MSFLSRILHREKPNPGRDLAMIRVKNERERKAAMVRLLCEEKGLPVPECFR